MRCSKLVICIGPFQGSVGLICDGEDAQGGSSNLAKHKKKKGLPVQRWWLYTEAVPQNAPLAVRISFCAFDTRSS